MILTHKRRSQDINDRRTVRCVQSQKKILYMFACMCVPQIQKLVTVKISLRCSSLIARIRSASRIKRKSFYSAQSAFSPILSRVYIIRICTLYIYVYDIPHVQVCVQCNSLSWIIWMHTLPSVTTLNWCLTGEAHNAIPMNLTGIACKI